MSASVSAPRHVYRHSIGTLDRKYTLDAWSVAESDEKERSDFEDHPWTVRTVTPSGGTSVEKDLTARQARGRIEGFLREQDWRLGICSFWIGMWIEGLSIDENRGIVWTPPEPEITDAEIDAMFGKSDPTAPLVAESVTRPAGASEDLKKQAARIVRGERRQVERLL